VIYPKSDDISSLDNRWTKAAVIGGLWASFEIVIGSFLHNMHLPFSGSILTFFATILLIAFYQVWPEKGLIWRAGLVCALMKSISPSGIILGPMTGIFMEALLADLVLRMIGNNIAGFLAAGMASQLSAILHKAGSLLILYGIDIVRIYENMFEFTVRHFKNIDITPVQALLFIVLIYSLAGLLAAVIGYRIGRNPQRDDPVEEIQGNIPVPDSTWDSIAPGQSFSKFLLGIHLIVLPVLLFVNSNIGLKPLILALNIIYILFCLIHYNRIKYRLMKPIFWIHLVLIGVLAGLFWKSPETISGSFHLEGWIMGAGLILRALLVITSFSALSNELRNPELKSYLFKIGFNKIYTAISMAFSALPLMMENGPAGKIYVINPLKALRHNIMMADKWLYVLQQKNDKPNTE
jgi:hypothetical protein